MCQQVMSPSVNGELAATVNTKGVTTKSHKILCDFVVTPFVLTVAANSPFTDHIRHAVRSLI